MNVSSRREVLQIKKYPNRRFYDATRSRHVTLQEVHDLIVNGYDVVITDSRTGEDITNLILLQVLLEKDQPKLDLFPSAILHLMIRSNRQMVRTFFERSFGPFLELLSRSQRQFDAYLRQAMSGRILSPFEWADNMMNAFSSSRTRPGEAEPPIAGDEPQQESDSRPVDSEAVENLRAQVGKLSRQIEVLTEQLADKTRPAKDSRSGDSRGRKT